MSIYQVLTRREVQIATLILDGFTNKEIANKLNLSFHTIRTHHKNIRKKTKQKTISGLIAFMKNLT